MEYWVDVMKALGHETRLRILIALSKKQLCVCELQGILDKPQPQISKQLAILKDLGIIKDVKIDKFVFYSLVENEFVEALIDIILESSKDEAQVKTDLENCKNSDVYRVGKC